MDRTRELCQEFTDLSEEDIEIILGVASTLQATAELMEANVFLDCMSKNGKAIVVAEAEPVSGRSSYTGSVIGRYALEENEPAVYETLRDGMVIKYVRAVTQESKYVIQNTAPIRNKSGRVIAVLILEQASFDKDLYKDLDDSRPIFDTSYEDMPEEFEYIDENMDFITENIDNSIIIFNKRGVAIYANKLADELYKSLGYNEKIVGSKFDSLSLDGRNFSQVEKNRGRMASEINVNNYFLEVKYNVMGNDKNIKGVNMTVLDVTEKVLKEKELMMKSVVIKEIHHRVKNNLQTVISLLRLQSRRVDNEYLQKAFQESISRISSIAITHELLAKEGIDEVYIIEIIKKLSENMIRYVSRPDLEVDIEILGDDFSIDSDRSTSIALVINEIIQNSIEHGFINREKGKISIMVSKFKNKVAIDIVDDGVGFDTGDLEIKNLGLNIVNQLVRDKLAGNLKISSSSGGTRVHIGFII